MYLLNKLFSQFLMGHLYKEIICLLVLVCSVSCKLYYILLFMDVTVFIRFLLQNTNIYLKILSFTKLGS